MTRYKAVTTILDYFSNIEYIDNDMQAALDEIRFLLLPHKKIWNPETIKDAIDDFVIKNDRLPTIQELDENRALPSQQAVKREYKMKPSEWYKRNYPNENTPNLKHLPLYLLNEQEVKELFVSEYKRINPSSGENFDKNRGFNIPSWKSFAKKLETMYWLELLKKCEVEYIKPKKEYNVSSVITNLE